MEFPKIPDSLLMPNITFEPNLTSVYNESCHFCNYLY